MGQAQLVAANIGWRAKVQRIWAEASAECNRDIKYIVCFMGAAIIRLIAILFSNFLLLWITSFVDEGLI